MKSGILAPVTLLCAALLLCASPGATQAQEGDALARAQALAAKGDWDGAMAATDGVGRVVIEWQRLREGQGSLSDYENFLAQHPDWPGLPLLREKGEAQLDGADPARVIAFFGENAPRSATGAIALTRALLQTGQVARAETVALAAWSSLRFSVAEEDSLIQIAGQSLGTAHGARLDTLLWEGREEEARRMLPRVSPDQRQLAEVRLALQAGADGVNARISALPAKLAQDAGLAHDRFVWRMKRERYDDALSLILDRSTDAARLGRPEAWAERRATLTRRMLREGRVDDAYALASRHQLGLGDGASAYADLEFLAGFIALRRMNDPALALQHFRHLEAGVTTPISLARAGYWIGRALEASGDASGAEAAYRKAAGHQTAYYGLLSAERLGMSLDPALATPPAPSAAWRDAAWRQSSVHRAAAVLRGAGDLTLAKRFWLHLAESLDATGLAQLADMALELDEPHIAVLVGKAAAERGLILPAAYYPVTGLVPDGLAVSRAFALAISRRESEFDIAARSHADARGLMQLLPTTAKLVAKEKGLPYDPARLTTDPAYNATLGSAYLAGLVEEFGPSIALVASGYNAGPGRPRQWIEQFGDPRRADVDIVDWVETIPFTETRTYVMRVVEGVIIYRARLKGEAGPVNITGELRGG